MWTLRQSFALKTAFSLYHAVLSCWYIKLYYSCAATASPCQTSGYFWKQPLQNINDDDEQKMKKRAVTNRTWHNFTQTSVSVSVCMHDVWMCVCICVWRERVCDLRVCLCVNWRAVVLRDHPFVSIWPSGCRHFPDTSHTHTSAHLLTRMQLTHQLSSVFPEVHLGVLTCHRWTGLRGYSCHSNAF